MDIQIKDFLSENYSDYVSIYKMHRFDLRRLINKAYRAKMEESGFFIGHPYSLKYVLKAPIFLVAKVGNETAGLIRIDKQYIDEDKERNILTWENKEIEKIFKQQIAAEIGVIMISKRYSGKGIGKKLFKEAETKITNLGFEHLFSWVVTNPNNKASISFHLKNGFTQVAIFNASFYEGVKNYQSYLFYKSV